MHPSADHPTPDDIAHFHARAQDLAGESRSLIRAATSAGFRTDRKPDQSFVTSTDTAVEQRLRELIMQWFPEHGIVGEEFAPHLADSEYQWILDPIDGTEEFVHRIPTYGTIIGLHRRGQPVTGVLDFPALDLRVHAARGLGCFTNGVRTRAGAEAAPESARWRVGLSARANFIRYRDDGALFDTLTRACPNHRIYRSCLGHALTAIGALDVYVDWNNKIWDLAAAQILAEEAGGAYRTVRTAEAEPGSRVYSAVFGKPEIVENVCRLLNAHPSS